MSRLHIALLITALLIANLAVVSAESDTRHVVRIYNDGSVEFESAMNLEPGTYTKLYLNLSETGRKNLEFIFATHRCFGDPKAARRIDIHIYKDSTSE